MSVPPIHPSHNGTLTATAPDIFVRLNPWVEFSICSKQSDRLKLCPVREFQNQVLARVLVKHRHMSPTDYRRAVRDKLRRTEVQALETRQ
jgi:hypothetical protein